MIPHVKNEVAPLAEVILGIADKMGVTPSVSDAYDPKSREYILLGNYPQEAEIHAELSALDAVLKKHNVVVHRPSVVENYNQIFARDIAFVIDNFLIRSNILPQRDGEFLAIEHVTSKINPSNLIVLPKDAHIEGGDVILWENFIFIGTYSGKDYKNIITARTNRKAIEYIQQLFPKKQVIGFDLIKSNTDARKNVLHLDCCFQPIGKDKAIIYKEGFQNVSDYNFLVGLFGEKNMFHVDENEMFQMFCNVFSIRETVIVSEQSFVRLNNWLREQGFKVEEIPFSEISKQGGLLRCSTMPLIRKG